MRQFGENLGRSVRDNPMPVALVGVGLAWMAFNQRSGTGQPARAGAYRGREDEYAYDAMVDVQHRALASADSLTRNADESDDSFRASSLRGDGQGSKTPHGRRRIDR